MDLLFLSIISLHLISADAQMVINHRFKHEAKDNNGKDGLKPADILGANIGIPKNDDDNGSTGYRNEPDTTTPNTAICITVVEGVDTDCVFTTRYREELKKSLHKSIKQAIVSSKSFKSSQAKGSLELIPEGVSEIELEFTKTEKENFKGRQVTVYLFKIPKLTVIYKFKVNIKTVGDLSGELDIDLLNQVVNTKFIPAIYDTGRKCYHQMDSRFTFNVADNQVYFQYDNATLVKDPWCTFGKTMINTYIQKGLVPVLEKVIIESLKNASFSNLTDISGSSNLGFENPEEGNSAEDGDFTLCDMPDAAQHVKTSVFAKRYMNAIMSLLRVATSQLFVNSVAFNNSQGNGKINLVPQTAGNIQLAWTLTDKETLNGRDNTVYSFSVRQITFKYRYHLSVDSSEAMSGVLDISLLNEAVSAKFVPVEDGNGSRCYKPEINQLSFNVQKFDTHYTIDKNTTLKLELREWGKRMINTFVSESLCTMFEESIRKQLAKLSLNEVTGTPQKTLPGDISDQPPVTAKEPQGSTLEPISKN